MTSARYRPVSESASTAACSDEEDDKQYNEHNDDDDVGASAVSGSSSSYESFSTCTDLILNDHSADTRRTTRGT